MSQHSPSTDSSSDGLSQDGLSQIGQYEVTSRIGRGSFGVVYKGRDPYLKRDVAIKVCTVDDESLRQRFYREAEIAGKLEHDHVVAVHAFGFEEGAPYLVQEFLEGQDLSHLIKQRVAWSGQRKLDILAQIAAALAYAHDQGVIHRDVKPANVRVLAVDPEVKVKLMDFGIAKLAHDESQLTQKGVTMGTASYLPPEQVKGGDVDHRGDIFAFGVLAYELLTMRRPFRGQTLSALVYQILYKAPKKLDKVWPGCPTELSQWVHKCLQKDPASRFADFHEVLEALAPIREGAAVGQWPALSEVWLPEDDSSASEAGSTEEEGSTEADARSSAPHSSAGPALPPLPSKAASEPSAAAPESPAAADNVLEESLGSQTRVMGGGSKKVDFDATQPVTPGSETEAETEAEDDGDDARSGEPEAVDAAATRRIADLASLMSSDGTDTQVPEELRTSAHEISKLVEAGDLEAAMAQLEETIHRHRGIASTAGVTDVLPLPDTKDGKPPRVEIDAERPTVEIPRETTEAARARGLAPPPLPASPAESAPPPLPTSDAQAQQIPQTAQTPLAPPPAEPELQRAPEAATGPQAASASTTGLPRRTQAAGGRGKLVVIGGAFAVAAILAVVMGWWLGRGRSEPVDPVIKPPPAPVEPVQMPQTGLVVQSTPWAVVTEISNADGYVMELPENATTPLYLPLEPGEYTVIVSYLEGNEEQRCEVQVTTEQSATCVTPFTQPTASDYFKDAGWYR